MESTEYTASIPSEAPRVCPMKALTELKGGIRVSKIRRMAFPSEASLLGVPVPVSYTHLTLPTKA